MEELALALTAGDTPSDDTDLATRTLRREVDFLKAGKQFKDIPARLTAYDSATGFYSWTWRDFGGTSNATRTDSANAVTGSPTLNPARTPDGRVISKFPVDCWLRPVGTDPTLGTIWEVADGPDLGTTFGLNYTGSYSQTVPVGGTINFPIVFSRTGFYIVNGFIGWTGGATFIRRTITFTSGSGTVCPGLDPTVIAEDYLPGTGSLPISLSFLARITDLDVGTGMATINQSFFITGTAPTTLGTFQYMFVRIASP